MKKLSCIQYFFVSLILFSIIMLKSAENKKVEELSPRQQDAEEIFSSIQKSFKKITVFNGNRQHEVEEINSPAIQQEIADSNKLILQEILDNSRKLDKHIAHLPTTDRLRWEQKQTAMLEPNKHLLKQAITNNLQSAWQQYGYPLANATFNLTAGFITAASVPLVLQVARIGTGNLLAFNYADLLIAGLTGVVGTTLTIMSNNQNVFIRSAGLNTFSQAIIRPNIVESSFSIETPSYSGPICSYMTAEVLMIGKKIVADSNILSRIDYKKVLLPTINQQTGKPSNELVAHALPHVQSVVNNPKITRVVTEIGWIITQSATVGGLLWLAGLGYGNTSFLRSVGYAALTGVAQGTLTAFISIGGRISLGGIITITLAPLAQQTLSIAGGTPQAAVTAVLQATTTEISNILLDESSRNGGLWPTLHRGKNLIGNIIINRWGSTWTTLGNGYNYIAEQISPIEQMDSGAGAFGF